MTETFQLKVFAGNHDRNGCPMHVQLSGINPKGPLVLRDVATDKHIPCQLESVKGGALLSWLAHGLNAGDVQVLRAKPSKDPASNAVRVEDDPEAAQVNVRIQNKSFTSYYYGSQWARPFLYPIMGPYGATVTRSWPVEDNDRIEERDHPHHKSLWVAHGECDKVDNWSEEPGHGYQVHRKFLAKASGTVYGRLVARNDWVDAKRRKQFEETRDLRFYALPGGERLFDIAVAFRMTEKDVTFRDTKEGGLVSVRVATSMDVRYGGTIENGYGGINEAETWGRKAPWCDYSGDVDGHRVGIAIMDHPDNPRYPTEWHVRDYGLMTANPFAWTHYRPERRERGDMTLRKGGTTRWKYRVFIHKGDAAKGRVGNRFHDYVAPPRVEVG